MLLFDQNLSHKLIQRISNLFPNSDHVKNLDMAEADDYTIWKYARDNNLTLVTQDVDFVELSVLEGIPPKIIWLRCGNTSTSNIEAILKDNSS